MWLKLALLTDVVRGGGVVIVVVVVVLVVVVVVGSTLSQCQGSSAIVKSATPMLT